MQASTSRLTILHGPGSPRVGGTPVNRLVEGDEQEEVASEGEQSGD